jgi:hypothetical protein
LAALALALAGCSLVGGDLSPRELCGAAEDESVRTALGAPAGADIAFSLENGVCAWRAPDEDGQDRELTAEIKRESDLRRGLPPRTGANVFEDDLRTMERDYPRTRLIGGLGDAAVMGFGEIGGGRFAGALVARKDGDILVLHIDGEDPAAFEAAARAIAEKM